VRLDGRSVLKEDSHFTGLTESSHKEDHSSRWSRTFWAVFAAINYNGSGEEEQIARSFIKLLFGLLGRISAKSSTNRIKKASDGCFNCFKHYIQVKVVKC